jgi:hypothetical protein
VLGEIGHGYVVLVWIKLSPSTPEPEAEAESTPSTFYTPDTVPQPTLLGFQSSATQRRRTAPRSVSIVHSPVITGDSASRRT